MGPLLEAVRNQDAALADQWTCGDQWKTVEQLLAHADDAATAASLSSHRMATGSSSSALSNALDSSSSGASGGGGGVGGGVGGGAAWTCIHCTFINPPNLTSCEICNLPHH